MTKYTKVDDVTFEVSVQTKEVHDIQTIKKAMQFHVDEAKKLAARLLDIAADGHDVGVSESDLCEVADFTAAIKE